MKVEQQRRQRLKSPMLWWQQNGDENKHEKPGKKMKRNSTSRNKMEKTQIWQKLKIYVKFFINNKIN